MKILLALFAHLLATLAKLLGAGDAKAIVADQESRFSVFSVPRERQLFTDLGRSSK